LTPGMAGPHGIGPKAPMVQEIRNSFSESAGDSRSRGANWLPLIERLDKPATRPLHILVVEDNKVNQLVATRILERLGHTWVTASGGREALLALVSEPGETGGENREAFDVVLMDIQMPEMDGFEVTRRIREFERRKGGHLPIIALTANAIGADRNRFLKAGLDGYIPKPVLVDLLVEEIRKVLDPVDALHMGGPVL
jgi:CheY-like chemotaxis protein